VYRAENYFFKPAKVFGFTAPADLFHLNRRRLSFSRLPAEPVVRTRVADVKNALRRAGRSI
jgi:hypothetical protein